MTKQKNRGKEADDDDLFGNAKQQLLIREAVIDMSHLLSRGYAEKSSLELVGNRYKLTKRQQRAVQGMSASDESVLFRSKYSLSTADMENKEAIIDGFNVLILLESLLSGSYIFKGRDGFYRDLSSVHGTYRKVQQTGKAIELVAEFFEQEKLSGMHWIFDKPVSNSGRLKQMIEALAISKNYNWKVSLEFNPDKIIAESTDVAITSDAWILDRAELNFNLLGYIIQKHEMPTDTIIKTPE